MGTANIISRIPYNNILNRMMPVSFSFDKILQPFDKGSIRKHNKNKNKRKRAKR